MNIFEELLAQILEDEFGPAHQILSDVRGEANASRLGQAFETRRAYFGPQRGWLDAKVINRSGLKMPHAGPGIVEEYDSTCLVPPGWTARLDEYGNIVMLQ